MITIPEDCTDRVHLPCAQEHASLARNFYRCYQNSFMDSSKSENSSYYVQLDALRAIAVAMVIYSHWSGYHGNMWLDNSAWFNGETGVQLFFVISGFLITGILLDEKHNSEARNQPVQQLMKTFYIRRFLRIFPAFYATLAIAYLLGHPDVRQSLWWHLTYMSNFFFALRGEYLGDVSHFWSLAVEEQFYLIWPFMICIIPRRHLIYFILGCILFSPVFRYCLQFFAYANETAVNVLPFSSLDALSAGALLAWIKRQPERKKYEWYASVTAPISGITFLLIKYVISVPETFHPYMTFLARVLLIPSLFGIVVLVSYGMKGFVGRILEWRPLLYAGKISYGLYLYHFFIPWVTISLCSFIGFPLIERSGHGFFLLTNIVLLLVIGSLSWLFFEKRINNLKRYFPYGAQTVSITRHYFNLQYLKLRFYRK
jgi:peptidoglycan/LPS O-acetylase OafA/YrhL